MRNHVKIMGIIAALLLGQIPAEVVMAISLPACTKDSDPSPLTFINPVPCGSYGEVETRTADSANPVRIRFMRHDPAGTPQAVVVLIAGGGLDTGITGDAATGTLTGAGANFLIRSAQLFAEDGVLALAVNRPLEVTAGGLVPEFPEAGSLVDPYRVSPKHAFDIVRVVAAAGAAGLPLFIVGTSRGSLSAVAANALGNGIMISSPLTSGPVVGGCAPLPACPPYWLGHPLVPQLQVANLIRPIHVMAHKEDGCPLTTPAGAEAFHTALRALGKDSRFDRVNGGFDLTGVDPDVDVCAAKTPHGFLGMENKAVREITKRVDEILRELRRRFSGNGRPVALPGVMPASLMIDLSTLVVDPNGDPLAFALPYFTSIRGNALMVAGTTVTLTPTVSGVDGFVYVASGGKGGIATSYVTAVVP